MCQQKLTIIRGYPISKQLERSGFLAYPENSFVTAALLFKFFFPAGIIPKCSQSKEGGHIDKTLLMRDLAKICDWTVSRSVTDLCQDLWLICDLSMTKKLETARMKKHWNLPYKHMYLWLICDWSVTQVVGNCRNELEWRTNRTFSMSVCLHLSSESVSFFDLSMTHKV